MNILVTGCNGQLGNEVQILAKTNTQHNYIFTDVIIPEGSSVKKLDITNEAEVEAFIADNSIDGIINCAAFTAVDKAESEESFCDLLNHKAPGYLAAAVGKRGGFMVQVSTDYVFDGTSYRPMTEDMPTCPNSVYGRTKLAGEHAVIAACPNSLIIRTAWLYSTFGNNFVKTMIRLGREKQELGVIFDQVGTPTYARDLAVAIFAAIEQGIVPGIYHFSNEGVTSWYDFTKAIHRIAGIKTCNVRPLHTAEYPAPAARPHYSVLDKTKFKETYHIEIPYWEDSLRECIEKL
ncbi:MAG: dTDP-4-dehydrorhamnose reductase [Bacteroidaceae bacterium]|nr:dTDP-4-dehydrorhamnose reductase [Bacteroidaceae bacterium]